MTNDDNPRPRRIEVVRGESSDQLGTDPSTLDEDPLLQGVSGELDETAYSPPDSVNLKPYDDRTPTPGHLEEEVTADSETLEELDLGQSGEYDLNPEDLETVEPDEVETRPVSGDSGESSYTIPDLASRDETDPFDLTKSDPNLDVQVAAGMADLESELGEVSTDEIPVAAGQWSRDADDAASIMDPSGNPGVGAIDLQASLKKRREPSSWRRPLLLTALGALLTLSAGHDYIDQAQPSTRSIADRFASWGNAIARIEVPQILAQKRSRVDGLQIAWNRSLLDYAAARAQAPPIEPPKNLEGTLTVQTGTAGLSHLAAAILGEYKAGNDFFSLSTDQQQNLLRTTYSPRNIRNYDQPQLTDVLRLAMVLAEQNPDAVRNAPSPEQVKGMSLSKLLELSRDPTKWVVYADTELTLEQGSNLEKLQEAYPLAQNLPSQRRDPLDRRRRRLEDEIERDALAYMDTYGESVINTAELYGIDPDKVKRAKELDDRMQEHSLRYQCGENIASIMDSTKSSLQKVYYDLNRAGINAVAERNVSLYESFLREKENNKGLTKIEFARRHASDFGVKAETIAGSLNTKTYLNERMKLIV